MRQKLHQMELGRMKANEAPALLVRLSAIDVGDNLRADLTEDLTPLMADIDNHGMMEPIEVRRIEGGRFQVVRGNRRLLCLSRLGFNAAMVRVVKE